MNQLTAFAQKALRGTVPTPADWEELLRVSHQAAPSMTPKIFASHPSAAEFNSYDFLAAALDALENTAPEIVDLACGDGHLVTSLLSRRPESRIQGIDMSEGELYVARTKFASQANVSFLQARAQELPLAESSVDAILCHMALMLMNPIEPVVSEIARVLKPGGIFAAVIPSDTELSGICAEADAHVGRFRSKKFPQIPPQLPNGDRRVGSLRGLGQLFHSETGFHEELQVEEFMLTMQYDLEQFLFMYLYTYTVEMLPPEHQAELRLELKSIFESRQIEGQVSYEFPMWRMTARRI